MLEYYGNVACVSAKELVESGIMSQSNYKQMASRGRLEVVRKAHGLGNYALVAVDSLPEKYKAEVKKMYPDGNRTRLMEWVKKNYERDAAAYSFFFDKRNTGVDLPAKYGCNISLICVTWNRLFCFKYVRN